MTKLVRYILSNILNMKKNTFSTIVQCTTNYLDIGTVYSMCHGVKSRDSFEVKGQRSRCP